jgi:hypothetical protein
MTAGDALLVPFMAVNPGTGWLADPETTVDPYVGALRHNLTRLAPPGTFNLAAARWQWASGNYALQTLLVASGSLHRLHLSNPAQNAQDLCTASHGLTVGRLTSIPGIPHSVSGLCDVAPHSSRFATVAAFQRGNVAVLMQFASFTYAPIAPRVAYTAVQQQYLTLPAGGVVVSSGTDVSLIAFWLVGLVALAVAVGLVVRRRGWREVVASVVAALRRRWLALAVSAVAVAGAMAFSMVDSSLLHGSGQWYESSFNDFWRNWADSIYLTHAGGYAHLYRLDNTLETAPAIQVVMAPFARLAAGLHFPDPNPVLYPQAYWVAGPVFLAFMALPICAGDRLLASMRVTETWRRLAVLTTMGVTLPVIALFGHSEDLVALGAMLYGLAAALEGRGRASGWWIGTALAFQPFAVLAVPIALVLLKRRDWVGAVVPMVVVPLAFLVVPLVGDFSLTVHQLVHQGVYDDVGYISPTWGLDPGVGAFVRALIALAAIPAALVLRRFLPRSPEDAANAVVWTVAVLLALRVFEPELLPYFVAPALALLTLSAARQAPWRLAAACLLAVWLNWWDHFAVDARWSMWLLLVGQLGLLGWLGWPVLQRATTRVVRRTPVTRSAAPAR